MKDEIDQLVVEGTITTESAFSKTTKVKIHRSATKTLYTFHEAGFEGEIGCGERVSFEGSICESKLPFSCPVLHIEQVTANGDGRFFIGKPLKGTHVGTYGTECTSISRDVNALLPNVKEVVLGQYACSCKQAAVNKLTQKLWNPSKQTSLYRSELTLTGLPQSKEAYEEEMCSILRLFGVMVSSSLYTRRTRYQFEGTGQVDHYWFNASAGVGMSKTIQDTSDFLKSAYSTWNSLSENMRDAIHIASTYIATSSDGYLDNRLFSLFVAWELLATAYQKEHKSEWEQQRAFDEEARDALGKSLNSAYEKWRDEYPGSNHHDIFNIKNLISTTKQITAKNKVDFLLNSTGLNPDKLAFNIDALRPISNAVRHTGQLKAKDEYGDDLELYDQGKVALQLIIFRLLGYDGRIWHHDGEWPTCNSMVYYFGTDDQIAEYEKLEREES